LTAAFDVWKEPWIPVLEKDGTTKEYGIRDCLCSAHELEAIIDPSPLIQFGIYRVLVVMLMDIYDTLNVNNPYEFILDLLESRKFCEEKLDVYYEKIVGAKRLDLFDNDYPFLQSAFDKKLDKEEKPVSYLLHHQPSGTNVTHFHHVTENELALSPAVCARALCTFQPFITTGGAGNAPSINGVPPLYVLLKGASLFETLCLNMVWMKPDERFLGEEPVSWRSNKTVQPKEEREQVTYMEGLTWRPRRVRLIPSEGGVCTYSNNQSSTLVRKMNFSSGFTARLKGVWVDPNASLRITNNGIGMMTPKEGREIWRDVGPLLILHEKDYKYVTKKEEIRYEKPLVLKQYEQIKREILELLKTEIYGLRTDSKNKYFEWMYEPLNIPGAYNTSESRRFLVQKTIEIADQTCYWLKGALKKLTPDSDKDRSYILYAQRSFWDSAKPPFFSFLETMSSSLEDSNIEKKMMLEWKKQLIKIANGVLKETFVKFTETGTDFINQAKAHHHFWPHFHSLFKNWTVKEEKGVRV